MCLSVLWQCAEMPAEAASFVTGLALYEMSRVLLGT
jgi:hypothetical protein